MRRLRRPFVAVCLFAAGLGLRDLPADAGIRRFTPIGPDGGEVLALAVDPGSSRTLYAVTPGAGIFKSVDSGVSWSLLPLAGTGGRDFYDLAIDPGTPSTLYAAVGTSVVKSRNGGASWAAAGTGLRGGNLFFVNRLAIDPVHPSTLYAATYRSGVFRSDDGAESWQPVGPALGAFDVTSLAIDPRDPSLVYAGINHFFAGGVYKSSDRGETWERATSGLPGGNQSSSGVYVAVVPDRPGLVFAAFGGELFRSADGGQTWRQALASGGFPLAVARGVIYAGGHKSVDGGLTWTSIPTPGVPLHALAVDPSAPRRVYAGSVARGVFASADGGAVWRGINRGLRAESVLGLATDAKNPKTLYAAVSGRLWALRLAGDLGGWRLAGTTDAGSGPVPAYQLVPDPATPRVFYGSTGGTLVKSVDGGRTFSALSLPVHRPTCFNLGRPAVDPTSPQILYAGGTAAASRCDEGCDTFKSVDGGASWSCMSLGGLERVYVDPAHPSQILAVNGQLLKSSNAGATWRVVGPPDLRFLSLAFDPRNPARLFAGTGRGVFLSVDGGAHFRALSASFDAPVAEVVIDPRSSSVLYAAVVATDSLERAGIYRSADGGRTFQKIPGLPSLLFTGEMALDPARPDTLYAATLGQGVLAATFR